MTRQPPEVLWCSNRSAKNGNKWSFPPNVEKRIRQDCEGKSVLHLFGGMARFGTRVDIDPLVAPDVIADAWLPPFAGDSFDVVVMDPPYTRLNAQMKSALFLTAAWIARERVIWFSTFFMASGAGLKNERAYLVRVGDYCHVRCLQYFQVVRPKLGPVKGFKRGPAMRYNRWLAQPQAFPFEAMPAVRPEVLV